jgi:uncharacterized membrane protein YfcA
LIGAIRPCNERRERHEMSPESLLAGAGIGLAGGLSSGLLGVSPGGALVVFSVLLLGAEQHVAQGVSLVAQIPPTSLAGIRRYRLHGVDTPKGWLVPLLVGYLCGGAFGALAASAVGASALCWVYVAYLAGLEALLIIRRRETNSPDRDDKMETSPDRLSLFAVGLLAGVSSGFLGIGGGLATTVGLTAGLGVRQRQAQMVSLVLSLVPTTAVSAWVYWREGWLAPWPLLLAVILGLVIGTNTGARLAMRISEPHLKMTLVILVAAMTAYMAYAALRS